MVILGGSPCPAVDVFSNDIMSVYFNKLLLKNYINLNVYVCIVPARVRAAGEPQPSLHRPDGVPVHVAVLHAAAVLQRAADYSQRDRHQWSRRLGERGMFTTAQFLSTSLSLPISSLVVN
jgi:hypothetical protein